MANHARAVTTVEETVTVLATQTSTALFHLNPSTINSAPAATIDATQTANSPSNAPTTATVTQPPLTSFITQPASTSIIVTDSAATPASTASSPSETTLQTPATSSRTKSTSFTTSTTTTTLPQSTLPATSTSTTFVHASSVLQTSTPSPTATPQHQPAPLINYSGIIAGLVVGCLFLASIFLCVRHQNRKRAAERRTALSHNLHAWHPPPTTKDDATLLQSINSSHAHLVHERTANAPIPAPLPPPHFLALSNQEEPSIHSSSGTATFYGSSPSRRRPATPSSDVSSDSGRLPPVRNASRGHLHPHWHPQRHEQQHDERRPRQEQHLRDLHPQQQPQQQSQNPLRRFATPSFPPAHYDDLPSAVPAPTRAANTYQPTDRTYEPPNRMNQPAIRANQPVDMTETSNNSNGGSAFARHLARMSPQVSPLFSRAPRFPPVAMQHEQRMGNVAWNNNNGGGHDARGGYGSYNNGGQDVGGRYGSYSSGHGGNHDSVSDYGDGHRNAGGASWYSRPMQQQRNQRDSASTSAPTVWSQTNSRSQSGSYNPFSLQP